VSLQLNEQQSKGITEAIKWFFNPDKDLVFTIGGYAGTGKSSTVNLLVELLGILTILSIMLIVAIPTITGTLKRNKERQYKEYETTLKIP
jgi:hypothetical protein